MSAPLSGSDANKGSSSGSSGKKGSTSGSSGNKGSSSGSSGKKGSISGSSGRLWLSERIGRSLTEEEFEFLTHTSREILESNISRLEGLGSRMLETTEEFSQAQARFDRENATLDEEHMAQGHAVGYIEYLEASQRTLAQLKRHTEEMGESMRLWSDNKSNPFTNRRAPAEEEEGSK